MLEIITNSSTILPKKGEKLTHAPSQSIYSTKGNHYFDLYHHRLSGNLNLNPNAANFEQYDFRQNTYLL